METKRYNTFYTPVGLLNIAHLGHGSVHVDWEGMHIYVDPYNDAFDFTGMKKADLIIGIGVRFSDRATGNVKKYAKNKKIFCFNY